MEKFIPYEKKSKKAKRAESKKKRGSWNGVNPKSKIIPDTHKDKRDKERMEELYNEQ